MADNDKIRIDQVELVYFHFHGLRPSKDGLWDSRFFHYRNRMTLILKNYVYLPYLKNLEGVMNRLGKIPFDGNAHRNVNWPSTNGLFRSIIHSLADRLNSIKKKASGRLISMNNSKKVQDN